MDIIFVNAIYFWNEDSINIGQAILRDILKDKYDVECINFDHLSKIGEIKYSENLEENIEIMGDFLIEKQPKILGFYTICNSFIISLMLAKYIKQKNPSIKIVFGGPQGTITSEECLKSFKFIDVICLGEAELSIELLVDSLINEEDLSNVPGISYVLNGKIIKNCSAKLISNEDFGKYIVYDYSPILIDPKIPFMVEGGRGCPFGCTFCTTSSFWKRRYRVKEVDTLINEIKEINKRYGVNKFSIQHDMFTTNRSHIIEFCNKIIEQRLPVTWKCSSRIDVLDKNLIDLMIKSNCDSVYIGIETGSQRMQKVIQKNLNLKEVADKIVYLHNCNLEVTTSFIFCFPDESIEDFKDTIKMMEHFIYEGIHNVQLHRFMPLPGTVETGKIKDIMYFDPEVLETSMNIVKLNDGVSEMIKNHPSIFSQYFTFDSEVKIKYKRFDVFMEGIAAMNLCYNNTLKILVDEYGLETIYFEMEHGLDELYTMRQNAKVSERMFQDLSYDAFCFNKLFVDYVKSKVWYDNKLFRELFKYEDFKFKYSISKESKPQILKFSLNIEKAIVSRVEEECDYYLKYSLRDGNVYTTHVIPNRMT